MLVNAAALAEAEILFRWQSIGRNAIVPDEVAPGADYQRDLARDMRALGWRMENGRYVRAGAADVEEAVTFTETAAAMRRVADGIDQVCRERKSDPDTGLPKPTLQDAAAVGAGVMLCWIRDLLMASTKESYDCHTLLVILEAISRDPEMFPPGVGQLLWAAEDEEDSGSAG